MKKLLLPVLVILLLAAGCSYLPSGTACAPLMPAINTFDANPSSISSGGTSTLSWTVSGATTVTIDQGIGSVALTGSRTVTAAATTIYTLTAAGAGGTVKATAQLVVSGATSAPPSPGAPVINSFVAIPDAITLGSTSTLSWNISGAISVSIDQGVGNVGLTGTSVVSPGATTIYTLTAANSSGSDTVRVRVVVSAAPTPPTPPGSWPTINYFSANPSSITAGNSLTLSWGVSNAASVSIDQGIGSVGLVGTTSVSPAATTSYTLTANNAFGWSSQTIVVLVSGSPVPIPQTIVLTPVLAETGSVYSAGGPAPTSSTLAGDTSGDDSIRAYFSFNISGLAGKNVTNARLAFTTQNIVRNPWPDLVGLWIGTVNYGIGPLQAADYNLSSSPLVGSYLNAPPGIIDVTSAVHSAAAAGSPRFQVRTHFTKATDSDHLADYIMWSNATLTVTYVP